MIKVGYLDKREISVEELVHSERGWSLNTEDHEVCAKEKWYHACCFAATEGKSSRFAVR